MTADECIRKYLGVPYKHGGRDSSGLDCYGMVVLVYKDLGISLPDYEYQKGWEEEGKDYFVTEYHKGFKKVMEPKLWDVVLFRNSRNSDVVNHVGIYVGEDQVLHCLEEKTILVGKLSHPYWRKRVYGYFRRVGDSN